MPKRRVRNESCNCPSNWRYLSEYLRDFVPVSAPHFVLSPEGYAYAIGAATAFFGLPWPDLVAWED